MTNVSNILEQLELTSKRTEKLNILSNNASNKLLQTVINQALDPYLQFWIRKIPEYQTKEQLYSLEEAISELQKLTYRRVTGHAAVDHLRSLLTHTHPDDANVLSRIISKDLRCGVQASTANAVFSNLVPTYPCLLGKGYDKKTIQEIGWPAYSQIKADGVRVNFHLCYDKILICGRSGKPMDFHGELDEAFDLLRTQMMLEIGDEQVLDGELVVMNANGQGIMSRKKGNGIINKAIRGTISKAEAARVRVRLWDIIPRTEFLKYKGTVVYKDRLPHISKFVSSITHEKYEMIETRIVNNLQEALNHYAEAILRGEEGIMLKDMMHLWENKRSKYLIKMKAEEDCDLVVIDWQEGTGKYEGMLGALICADSTGRLVVSVGSGFSDQERIDITRNDIGRIVTLKYNERITAEDKQTESLFLPRFMEFRDDKNEANHINDIK